MYAFLTPTSTPEPMFSFLYNIKESFAFVSAFDMGWCVILYVENEFLVFISSTESPFSVK